MKNTYKIGWLTAASLVISNMIGTGVFTSLGYQLLTVNNSFSIIALWLAGGMLALTGAFTFAELATHYKKSGGEYVYISKAIHPLLGYLSAWSSLIIGFSAPVAIAAIAMEAYLKPFAANNNDAAIWFRALSVALIIGICAAHSFTVKQSSKIQNIATAFKIFFVLAVIALGIWLPTPNNNSLFWGGNVFKEVFSSGFAVSLLYVTYAYTGWNAATYIVEEIENPRLNLPKALIAGTLFVTITYIAIQLVLLKLAPPQTLKGNAEVAIIAFEAAKGAGFVKWISLGIAVQLIATMSSCIWVGSRVTYSMSKDYTLWKPINRANAQQIPVVAIWLHGFIALIMLFSGKLEEIMLYSSFVMQLMSVVAIISFFFTKPIPDSFKSPLRPWLQIFYILLNICILLFVLIDKPKQSLMGLSILVLGVASFYLSKFLSTRKKNSFTNENF
ncbi:MAG: amino acid permease [Sphingobacteriales bacterium]|jgi:amino acid transporter|nr:amino acid permease [Sphingobacteriales bacterium]MBP9142281.1 amino acid permease [Chitinophagales bacterium]MDA0198565.1 amino acid permease [Bacteroidota bacterium]MBK6889230.1 amino acid permease [Sphingobacteriales bacterium]MBK7528264.1 amino acid permease [Sphingobacteriales bacterium]